MQCKKPSGRTLIFSAGLDLLYKAYNTKISLYSSARHPPPQCHKGCFQSDIKRLVDDAMNASPHPAGLVWIHGAMGVGKSANAQSFAESLSQEGSLASAVFLPPPDQDELCLSGTLLPTVAYNIAQSEPQFGQALGVKIRHNPAILTEALPQLFSNLFVAPSRDLASQGRRISKRIIIVDGIESCGDDGAQRELIDLIATSMRQKSTPFLWVFFTRKAPHLQAAFVASGCKSLELTMSRELDTVISAFLSDNLNEIAWQNGFTKPWPPTGVVEKLVQRSAGFPLYASSLLDFIGSGPSDPTAQLKMILDNESSPLLGIDNHYTTLMRNIPLQTLGNAQRILLAISVLPHVRPKSNVIIQLLDMSEPEFNTTCQMLQPVLRLSIGDDGAPELSFYHTAFMEFMQDASRSKDLCIWCCAESFKLRRELSERLLRAQDDVGQSTCCKSPSHFLSLKATHHPPP